MKSIVIFGGAGFIGKHLIRRLAKNEYKIIVPYQRSTKEEKLRFLGYTGQVIPIYYNSLEDKKIRSFMDNQQLNEYVKFIIDKSFDANKYFNDEAPWNKKDDKKRLNTIVYVSLEIIRKTSIMLYPIIPSS